jgi:hypothetical protein
MLRTVTIRECGSLKQYVWVENALCPVELLGSVRIEKKEGNCATNATQNLDCRRFIDVSNWVR